MKELYTSQLKNKCGLHSANPMWPTPKLNALGKSQHSVV